MKKPGFKVGDKVFAKVKGYPPWPAKIIAENGKRYNVEFYGTKETGVIKIEDLFYFKKNKQKFQRPLKRKDYLDAFEQIEQAIAEDGGDGEEYSEAKEIISENDIINSSSSLNTSTKEKKTVKRERTSSTKSEITPVKKSLRLTKADEAESVSSVAEEKEPSVTPAKKSPKSPRVKKEKEIKDEESTKPNDDESSNKSEQKTDNDNVTNEPLQQESEEKLSETLDTKIEILTDKDLKYDISYGKHVEEMKSYYKEIPVEPRNDFMNHVLPVQLTSGVIAGIKLHADWPLEFDNEYDRATYDKSVAQNTLNAKVKILSGETNITSDPKKFIPDIGLSAEEIKQQAVAKDVKLRTARVERLKKEAELVSLDGKIKNCLGLDKADPKEAIGYLEEMNAIDFDVVMLKKHLHIVEMVRRLRKYVGNTKEWKMTDDSLTEFSSQAEKVRSKAEEVYAKFKEVAKLPQKSTSFFEGFTELVSQFRSTCKEMDMSETDVFVLCAEPKSRQAFLDRLHENETEEISTEDTSVTGADEITTGTG